MFSVSGIGFVAWTWLSKQILRILYYLILKVVAPGLEIQNIQVSVSDAYRIPRFNDILFSLILYISVTLSMHQESVKTKKAKNKALFGAGKEKAYIFVESESFVRINLEWCIYWLSNVSFKFNAQLVIYH